VADAVKFVRPETPAFPVSASTLTREFVTLAGRPLALVEGGETLWVHADHLGTPQKMTDSSGQVVWDALFTPFGEMVSLAGTAENPKRFPGQRYDAETALHYNYFRDYDPSLGRYVQSDPIGLEGGVNTYGYVNSNPLRYSDSSGLILDTLADLGFIAYDVYCLLTQGPENREENWAALGADAVGAVAPGATGLGMVYRAGKSLAKNAKSAKPSTLRVRLETL
jgi:RHS repeat-associated protein